jgi:hypothetical protein
MQLRFSYKSQETLNRGKQRELQKNTNISQLGTDIVHRTWSSTDPTHGF